MLFSNIALLYLFFCLYLIQKANLNPNSQHLSPYASSNVGDRACPFAHPTLEYDPQSNYAIHTDSKPEFRPIFQFTALKVMTLDVLQYLKEEYDFSDKKPIIITSPLLYFPMEPRKMPFKLKIFVAEGSILQSDDLSNDSSNWKELCISLCEKPSSFQVYRIFVGDLRQHFPEWKKKKMYYLKLNVYNYPQRKDFFVILAMHIELFDFKKGMRPIPLHNALYEPRNKTTKQLIESFSQDGINLNLFELLSNNFQAKLMHQKIDVNYKLRLKENVKIFSFHAKPYLMKLEDNYSTIVEEGKVFECHDYDCLSYSSNDFGFQTEPKDLNKYFLSIKFALTVKWYHIFWHIKLQPIPSEDIVRPKFPLVTEVFDSIFLNGVKVPKKYFLPYSGVLDLEYKNPRLEFEFALRKNSLLYPVLDGGFKIHLQVDDLEKRINYDNDRFVDQRVPLLDRGFVEGGTIVTYLSAAHFDGKQNCNEWNRKVLNLTLSYRSSKIEVRAFFRIRFKVPFYMLGNECKLLPLNAINALNEAARSGYEYYKISFLIFLQSCKLKLDFYRKHCLDLFEKKDNIRAFKISNITRYFNLFFLNRKLLKSEEDIQSNLFHAIKLEMAKSPVSTNFHDELSNLNTILNDSENFMTTSRDKLQNICYSLIAKLKFYGKSVFETEETIITREVISLMSQLCGYLLNPLPLDVIDENMFAEDAKHLVALDTSHTYTPILGNLEKKIHWQFSKDLEAEIEFLKHQLINALNEKFEVVIKKLHSHIKKYKNKSSLEISDSEDGTSPTSIPDANESNKKLLEDERETDGFGLIAFDDHVHASTSFLVDIDEKIKNILKSILENQALLEILPKHDFRFKIYLRERNLVRYKKMALRNKVIQNRLKALTEKTFELKLVKEDLYLKLSKIEKIWHDKI